MHGLYEYDCGIHAYLCACDACAGYLIEQIGTNNVTDMFPPRAWSFDWLNAHCAARALI